MRAACFVTIAICAVMLALQPALAQQTQAAPAAAAPAPTPPVDLSADLFKTPTLPPVQLDTARGKQDQESGFSLPDKIDLGASVLHFDTNRVDNLPRVGIENTDPKVLNPTAKEQPLTPNYFGLRLTKPVN